MPEVSFDNLLGLSLVAAAAPFVVRLAPRLRLPAVVVEILAGILFGPSVLGWIEVDLPVEILSLLGLAYLLFLGGTEIDPDRLRGGTVRSAGLAYGLTVLLGLGVGAVVSLLGLAGSGTLVAVALSATSLGVVLAVLGASGRTSSDFGQRLIANASVSDFGAVLLLSILFAQGGGSVASRLALFVGLVVLAVVAALGLTRVGRGARVSAAIDQLEQGTSEVLVRISVVLMFGFAVLAVRTGVEAILGAFLAGAIVSIVARKSMTEARLQPKLQALGYGFLAPAFFITAGLRFDLAALMDGGAIAAIPVFVVALLVVRGVPALVFERAGGWRSATAMGLLQATTLSFLVTVAQIGLMGGLLDPAAASALLAAGLVSVAVFPPVALGLLVGEPAEAPQPQPAGGTRS
jgi:Kef-type K+ transport system membrane component KefB